MNNQKIYNRIMREVSIKVMQALNEAFAYENDEIGDKIINIVKHSDNIMAVVKDAEIADWKQLLKRIQMLTKKECDNTRVARIVNMDSLAIAIGKKLQDTDFKTIAKSLEADKTAMYIVDMLKSEEASEEIIAAGSKLQAMPNSDVKARPLESSANECNCKNGEYDCKNGECDCKNEKPAEAKAEAKPVHESYKAYRTRMINEAIAENVAGMSPVDRRLFNRALAMLEDNDNELTLVGPVMINGDELRVHVTSDGKDIYIFDDATNEEIQPNMEEARHILQVIIEMLK